MALPVNTGKPGRYKTVLITVWALAVVLTVMVSVAWLALLASDERSSSTLRLFAESGRLKGTLQHWLENRKSDAQLVALEPDFIQLVNEPGNASMGMEAGPLGRTRAFIERLAALRGYDGVVIADRAGQILVQTAAAPVLGQDSVDAIRRVVSSGNVAVLGTKPDAHNRTDMVLMAPIFTHATFMFAKQPHRVEGVVALFLDCGRLLGPLLEETRTGSMSTEAYLVKNVKNGGLAVTPLRFEGPVQHADLSTQMLGEFSDYRGKPVVGVIQPVLEGDWSLVVKQDEEDALQSFYDQRRWFLLSASILLILLSVLMFATWRTIHERHSRALSRAFERYRLLAENAREIILFSDCTGRILVANQAAVNAYGFTADELCQMSLTDLEEPGSAQESASISQGAPEGLVEAIHRRRNKDTFPVESSSRTVQVQDEQISLSVIRDVTDRKKLEEQVRLAQRMESIGRLAGGIAHDFNNLLTAIQGYASLALASIDNPAARDEIEEVLRASARASKLTRQLLTFSRHEVIQPRRVDLSTLILEMDRLLRRLIGDDVTLNTMLEPDLWPVFVDPTQIEQVLINLVVNARDAMPSGGEITISCGNVTVDAQWVRRHSHPMTAGDYIRMSVVDNGVGMASHVREHLFEPFFTTKEPDKGTGLGLAICYGIVKQNRGFIWVSSEPSQGTTIDVYLPRTHLAADASVDTVVRDRSPLPRGVETILLAEDNAEVRAFSTRILRDLGYRVVAVPNGQAALTALDDDPTLEPDILVTDIVMPGLGGIELSHALASRLPRLRILLTTGFAGKVGSDQPGAIRWPVLDKPFSGEALARKVREILDADVHG